MSRVLEYFIRIESDNRQSSSIREIVRVDSGETERERDGRDDGTPPRRGRRSKPATVVTRANQSKSQLAPNNLT